MELIGPSLSSVLKRRPSRALSLSTCLRFARHSLLALESLHRLGFVHRDVKPGNLLIRISPQSSEPPLCLIDFGLVRIYRDQRTREHERPRRRTGFRGTKTYASLNAHAYADLSRRDDLISWFYVVVDALQGGLPWKGVTSNVDVAMMKNQFDVRAAVQRFAPALFDIWQHIARLKFDTDPDYEFMLERIDEAARLGNIQEADAFDWAPQIEEYKRTIAAEFAFARALGEEETAGAYYTELGLPPTIMQQLGRKGGGAVLQPTRAFSVMQPSEMNEGAAQQCCC